MPGGRLSTAASSRRSQPPSAHALRGDRILSAVAGFDKRVRARLEFKRTFDGGVRRRSGHGYQESSSMGGKVVPFDAPTISATQTKILDTAEGLFMEHGFEATSLRQITTAAGVNLAAVNYHFGSKEELFQTVLTRRLDPMNQERMTLLARFEREIAPRQ